MRQMNNLIGLFYSVHLRRHLISPDVTKLLFDDRKEASPPTQVGLEVI